MAMLQVAINPLLRVAGGEPHFAFNSVMAQLVFGAASFLSPMVFSYLVKNLHGSGNALLSVLDRLVPAAMPWTALYWLFAVLFFLMAATIGLSRFPAVQRKDDEIAGSWATHLALLRQKTVLLFFIGIFCYVGTEQGVSYWMSKFLAEYHGFDPQTIGAAAVGRFWGLMSVGCLLGLVLLKLFDSRRILVGAALCALALLSLALFGPAKISLMAFPLVGFALSVMWSIIFSLALNSVPSHHGSFAGILCTAIIGGAVIQLFIGWLGDLFGLRAGMLFIFVTLGYVLGIGLWARPIITNETIFAKKVRGEPAAAGVN
jgi:fucose permease